MEIKLQGNDMLCMDVIPNIKIAEFNEELACIYKQFIVLWANFGQEFIELYQRHRIDMNINNMAEMIEKMEILYQDYNYELLNIRRNNG